MLSSIGDDPDEGSVDILALAAIQWKYGRLRGDVKTRALNVIDSGEDLIRWQDSDITRRRTVLQALKKKLQSPQPLRTTPRPRRDVPLTMQTESLPSADGRAAAYVWQSIEPHVNTPLHCQVCIEFEGGGSGLVSAYCRMQDVDVKWDEDDTLVVTLPEGSEAGRAAGWPKDSDTYTVKRVLPNKNVVLRFQSQTAGPDAL